MNNAQKYQYIIKLVDPRILDNMQYEHETNREILWEQWEYLKKVSELLLSQKQYRVFKMMSFGVPQKEIAVRLHITTSGVSSLKADMIKRLQYFIGFARDLGKQPCRKATPEKVKEVIWTQK